MHTKSFSIPYNTTGFFSKLVTDYIAAAPALQPFYAHPVTIQGIEAAIAARRGFATKRELLVQVLTQQYEGITLTPKQATNLQLLLQQNTFTVTTAHQPNIFTGPLYFIYKIMHAIKLAESLQQQMPAIHVVPVYYMGSEDADLEELNFVHIGGKKYTWQTTQKGAVGRMKVDKALLDVINEIGGQIGVAPFGDALKTLLTNCYTIGKTIQQATLELVNHLFADYGLLVVIPDNALLKKSFEPVVAKEITSQFSHAAVSATTALLAQQYKVQASGRELNLFYLIDDVRERIELSGKTYTVAALSLSWTQEQLLAELALHPERFSANVILRGVFQETIFPNIAFIGGGGEIAYWLELKKVFEAVDVPFPMLIVRNSFLMLSAAQQMKIEALGFDVPTFFKPTDELVRLLVRQTTTQQLLLTSEKASLTALYEKIGALAGNIDITLQHHTKTLLHQALKPLNELEKKMLRAEKRNYMVQAQQITALKENLFPAGNLQERTDNFSLWYANYGAAWLDAIYQHSQDLQQTFVVIAHE